MNKLEELKISLIEEVNKRMVDKIIEPTNAELLIKLINNAESETEALAIAELGTTYKRTGFHFDKRLEKMGSDIKYLVKNEDLSFVVNKDSKTHKLIIGDNYDALLNLDRIYRGMIDVIYIDPPYGSNSMGEFADTNYTNAITRDNLLSMLYPRLQIAKELLSEEGVICCSIDDRNMAYIKCLFDEVFDESNLLGIISVVNNLKGRSDDLFFATATEYLLVYAKDVSCAKINGFSMSEEQSNEYKFSDEIGNYKLVALKKTGKNCYRENRVNLYYPIYFDEVNNVLSLEEMPNSIKIVPEINGRDGCWRWGKEKFNKYGKTELVCKKSKEGYQIYVKMRDSVDGEMRTVKPKTVFLDPKYDSGNGTRMLKDILGDKIFENPKPVEFLKDIFHITSSKNSIILDFFAGSGTTGQAVMELNKEDGGNRQFILCTNNEITNTTPNGIALDVTTKRLKRIMSGFCYDNSSDFKWGLKNEPFGDNLDVLDIKYVNNAEYREGKSAFEVIDETLYDLPKFESIEEKIHWVCNNFERTQKYLKGE